MWPEEGHLGAPPPPGAGRLVPDHITQGSAFLLISALQIEFNGPDSIYLTTWIVFRMKFIPRPSETMNISPVW